MPRGLWRYVPIWRPSRLLTIVTGKLSYFPLPSFVTLFAFGGRGDLGEPVTNCGRTQHAAALLDRRGRRLLGHIAPLATVTSSRW